MRTATRHQSDYWDNVANHIQNSDAPDKDLVGYHSPYDVHVRRIAIDLLDRVSNRVAQKNCIAELGSGAGLNLKHFARLKPEKLLAFDCSPCLLALAKSNLVALNNVQFIQTGGDDLPVPSGTSIDLLFTMTVLQHITDPEMYRSVIAAMKDSGAVYILILEDTLHTTKQKTPDYILRSPADYVASFSGGPYTLVISEFASLTWASRLFGAVNRLFGLYKREEGSSLPKPLFIITRFLSPLAGWLDALLPGKFGMSAALFRREAANG